METFTEAPAPKTYRAANGHEFTAYPNYSQHSGEWYFIYSLAEHSDSCDCATWDVDDWGDIL